MPERHIIPEKNLNKTGALSLSGSVWAGQNIADFFVGGRDALSPIPYDADPSLKGIRYAVPVSTGGWGQISYYLTDKVFVNGLYGFMWNNFSQLYQKQYPDDTVRWQNFIVNILYDVNPAIRIGAEYAYVDVNFCRPGNNAGGNEAPPTSMNLAGYVGGPLSTKGTTSVYRVGLWYYF